MTIVRFGIIGAGAISRLTCRDIAAHPAARLVAVADPDAARAGALAKRFDVTRIYGDASQLLNDPEIDAVYIAVPNVHHAPLARAALEAGKHTLLDKPFAIDYPAARTVADAIVSSGRVFMVGMNQRFERVVQRAHRLVADGRLGQVYHVKAFWRRRAGIPRIGSWFGNRGIAGGGALLDIGVHMLDAALYVIGNFRPVAVSGVTYTRFGNRGLGDGNWGLSEREHTQFDVEDFASALIRLESGTSIALDACWAAHQPNANELDIQLYGTDAGMSVYRDEMYEARPDGGYSVIHGMPAAGLAYPDSNRVTHFVNTVLGAESPCIGIDEALAVQRILDAIYESSRTGREVAVEEYRS